MRLLFGALVLLELLGLLLTPIARPVAAAAVGPQLVPRDAQDGSPRDAPPVADRWGESLSEGEGEGEGDDADPLAPCMANLSMMRQASRRAWTFQRADEGRPGTRTLPERPPRRLG